MAQPLQTQLQFLESNGRAIAEVVTKMIKIQEENELFLNFFAKSLAEIAAQENCGPFVKCLEDLSKCGQNMAKECHEVMILRPEREIVQLVSQIQDGAIGPMKKLLEDREKAVKIEVKLQTEYDELKRGSSAKEKEKKMRMLSDQRRRVENVNELVDTHMENFDHYRLQKMKKIVSDLARSQVFYHAKGLELFTVPCQAIAKLQTTGMKGTAQVIPTDAS